MRYRMITREQSKLMIKWCNHHHVKYSYNVCLSEMYNGDKNYIEFGMTDGMWDIYDHDNGE